MLMIGIAMAAMAAANQAKFFLDLHEQEQALKDKIDDLEEQRDNYLHNLTTKYTIDKVNSLNAADEKDRQADYTEKALDRDVNDQMKQLESQGYLQALGYNQQAQQAGQQTGAELATQATSGTRGSTANQAIDFESKNAETMLQASQTAARDESDYNLHRLIYSYMDSRQQLQNTRTDAYNNRATFAQAGDDYGGGIKYRANGTSYTAFNTQYNYEKNQYDKAIEKLKDQRDDMLSGWNKFKGFALAGIQGANQGVGLGIQIEHASGYLWNNVGGSSTGGSN